MLAALVEDLHAVGDQRFHDRNTARERGKAERQEKGDSHKASDPAHGGKDVRKADKGEARTAFHAVFSEENIYGGDNQKSRKESDAGIEYFDAGVRLIQVHVILHVASVGDHDTHADAEREEQLTHGIEHHVEEFSDRHTGKIGLYVDQKSLKTRAGRAVLVGVRKGQCKDCDHYDQQKKCRH